MTIHQQYINQIKLAQAKVEALLLAAVQELDAIASNSEMAEYFENKTLPCKEWVKMSNLSVEVAERSYQHIKKIEETLDTISRMLYGIEYE